MSDRDLTTPVKRIFGDVPKGTNCRICGRNVEDGRAKLCSDYCRSIQNTVMSLLNWTGVRRRVVERDDKTCQWCGFDQDWLDRGQAHLIAMTKEECPEPPDSRPIAEWVDLSDDEKGRILDERQEWREACYPIAEKYLGIEWCPFDGAPAEESYLEVDHIIPVSEGGHPFDPANLQTLCTSCHKEKTAAEATGRAEQAERPDVTLIDFEKKERKPRVENSYQRPPRCPDCGGETRLGPKHGAAVVECRDCEYRGRFYPIKEEPASPNTP